MTGLIFALVPGTLGGLITFFLMSKDKWSPPTAGLAGVVASVIIGLCMHITWEVVQ